MSFLNKIVKSLCLLVIFQVSALAQTAGLQDVKGTIKDETTGEPVPGAVIMYAPGKAVQTDVDGNYSMKIPDGAYTFTISYTGYKQVTQSVTVSGSALTVDSKIKSSTDLDEVEVVADVAKTRETPVAMSNITEKQIKEELGARDLPMLLNSTPGVYATQQGGGAGDARINIRGFDQRYVAVMIDGVPVNDMENGQVYWSNWSGLSEITRAMQVQRGLGASRLAVPSVGGTMNILTQSIDSKRSLVVKEDHGSNNYNRIAIGFNSGLIKNKFGFTLAGSYTGGNGWVDQTYQKTWAYFAKFQYRINSKHLITVGFNGAPQEHGQKVSKMQAAIYDRGYAVAHGSNADSIYKSPTNGFTTAANGNRGLAYNPDWGYVNGKAVNTRVNYFHKPLLNISHFYNINEKMSWSNVLYASYGKGGGTSMIGAPSKDAAGDGQLLLQSIYDHNSSSAAIIPFFDPTRHQSNQYIISSVNNHKWYGLLSTLNWQVAKRLHFTGGVDGRYYIGTHYQTPYNLLGGDYVVDSSDPNLKPISGTDPASRAIHIRQTGDKVGYYNDTKISWLGLFSQLEYKKDRLSVFLTLTGNQSGYQYINYFAKKEIYINKDKIFHQAVGYGDTLYYNGTDGYVRPNGSAITYNPNGSVSFHDGSTPSKIVTVGPGYTKYSNNSKEARTDKTSVKVYYGYTAKGGANYNLTDHQNVFINLGYMSLVPKFNNVFGNNGMLQANVKNQLIEAVELGYGIKYRKFAINVNGYYTIWQNKPLDFTPSTPDNNGNLLYYNINGINALHKGIEVDGSYNILKNLKVEAFGSLADWRYTSGMTTAYVYNTDNSLNQTINFSAKNVHVGNSAQDQLGASVRYEPFKRFYIKPRITYFAKNYAQFDPGSLTFSYVKNSTAIDSKTDYRDRESLKLPNYYFMELFAGYSYKFKYVELVLTGSIQNLLDNKYITDASFPQATNPLTYNNVNYATVYMSQGRRYNLSLAVRL